MSADPAPVDVVVTLDFDADWLRRTAAVSPRLRVHHHPATDVASIPPDVLARARVLYTGSAFPTRAQAPDLAWVQLDTSGADHVIGHELWSRDVPITTIGGVSPRPLAEYVLMMILAHAHHLPHMAGLQREGRWPDWPYRWNRLMPRRLDGATVGIVGYGRIGREIGRLADAFGMRVIGMRRGGARPGDRYGEDGDAAPARVVGPDGLPGLLAESDYLVLTVPLTDATRGLLDAEAFGHVKPGAFVINAARGGVVDEDALLACLRSGRLSGAALDVFATEPLPAGHPLWTEPNVLITPHVAGFAPAYHEQVGALFRENLRRFLDGEPLLNQVDRTAGY